jgi:tetratricopeptide (TPR) repeat protein
VGLFGKDWSKELDRAEDLLRRDLPAPALEIATRAERKVEPVLRTRAADLAARARHALLASVLAKADAAEAGGYLEDAADWLLSAIEHEPIDSRRAKLEHRRRDLLDRAFDAAHPAPPAALMADGDHPVSDDAFRYDTLVAMLDDELQHLYRDRPEPFRRALLDLNEGRASIALGTLEGLGNATPEDAALRLERGRARLLAGDAAAARDDFEAAWRSFGDHPLDANATQFAPALWAEACLAAGDAVAVVERLETLAAPATGPPEICRLYAAALLQAERLDAALGYLEAVTALLPDDLDLQVLLARARMADGDPLLALALLDAAMAPSCSAAGCGTPAPHPPAFRLLARLLLRHGDDPERARALVAQLISSRRGAVSAEDLAVLAEYYSATGNPDAAREAAAEVERLEAQGEDAELTLDAHLGQRRGTGWAAALTGVYWDPER